MDFSTVRINICIVYFHFTFYTKTFSLLIFIMRMSLIILKCIFLALANENELMISSKFNCLPNRGYCCCSHLTGDAESANRQGPYTLAESMEKLLIVTRVHNEEAYTGKTSPIALPGTFGWTQRTSLVWTRDPWKVFILVKTHNERSLTGNKNWNRIKYTQSRANVSEKFVKFFRIFIIKYIE